MIPADESADEADHSQRSTFVHFVDAFDSKLVKRFLGIVNLTTCEGFIYEVHMFRGGGGVVQLEAYWLEWGKGGCSDVSVLTP